jgi:hypothetical protein
VMRRYHVQKREDYVKWVSNSSRLNALTATDGTKPKDTTNYAAKSES